MSCERFTFPGGDGFACARGRAAPCGAPGCDRPHTSLCDFLVRRRDGASQTCDAKLCDVHRVRLPGTQVDYCLPHAAAATKGPR